MATNEPVPVPISFRALLDAVEFASFSGGYEDQAYICTKTGAVYWVSGDADPEDDLPEDIETSDQYIGVPHKKELNIGLNLVISFVEREIPDAEGKVSGMFRGRGGWRRFKDHLSSRGLLDKWYAFEEAATEAALREWCEANDISVRED